ncbi:MAG: hypothetical protein ACR2M7_04460 [Bdellovibrionales bacterium]
MKKINLLAVILFFAMAAKAHGYSRVYSGKYDENPYKHLFVYFDRLLSEACEVRKNFITCVEDSTNAKEIRACGSDYYKIARHIHNKEKDTSGPFFGSFVNYKESLDYEKFNTEAIFDYTITSSDHPYIKGQYRIGKYNFHDAIQIHPSCDKIKISKKSLPSWSIFSYQKPTGEIFYQILKADNPNRFSSVKMCALSIASEMNRVQKCNDLTN